MATTTLKLLWDHGPPTDPALRQLTASPGQCDFASIAHMIAAVEALALQLPTSTVCMRPD